MYQKIELLEMNKKSEEIINEMKTSIGNMESYPPPVIFSAYKAEYGGSYVFGDVTYDTLVENVGNGLDIRTGVFTVPQTGLYLLSFSGMSITDGTWTNVGFLLNGVEVFHLVSESSEEMQNRLGETWILNLEINDQVNLKVNLGLLYSNSKQRINFNGYLNNQVKKANECSRC